MKERRNEGENDASMIMAVMVMNKTAAHVICEQNTNAVRLPTNQPLKPVGHLHVIRGDYPSCQVVSKHEASHLEGGEEVTVRVLRWTQRGGALATGYTHVAQVCGGVARVKISDNHILGHTLLREQE